MSEESFTDRVGNRPTVLYDDTHGTRIKLFTNKTAKGEFDNVVIESGYYDKDETWVAQKVQISPEKALAIVGSLQSAHSLHVEKQLQRAMAASQSRAA